MRFVLLLLACLLPCGTLPADEAIGRDGERLEGELSLSRSGKLQLTLANKRKDLPWEDVQEVRFEPASSPVFRGAPLKVLHLPDGQRITGVFLGMEKNNLLVRTAWAERLAIPRNAAVALTHQPGFRPVFVSDFDDTLSGWASKGSPSAKKGILLLSKVGQSLAHSLSAPLAAGRIGVNVREEDTSSKGRWQVEAHFAPRKGERVLRIDVAGGKTGAVDSGGLAGTAQPRPRAEGWRRLVIDFSAGSVRIRCDDHVLWYTLAHGPGGPLRQVRLMCTAAEKEAVRGGVSFSDFVIERAVSEKRRPPAEPGQDELWLQGGDQIFGQVVRADPKGIAVKARFGVRRFPWTALRGWYLQHGKPAVVAPGRGPRVRVWLRTGVGPALDVLDGQLTALDAKKVSLRHPLLGDVVLPRAHVARLGHA